METLVVSLNGEPDKLYDKMGIETDAVITNQCDKNEVYELDKNGKKLKVFSFAERGVGVNRNNGLLRASADIVLFADDDETFDKGYAEKVLNEFNAHPEADVITFNVIPLPETISPDLNLKWKRVRFYNCLKYGAVRIAVRLDRLREKNIFFSLLFGGGAKYSSGEDTIFITDCLKKGLKVYASPERIGTVVFEESWFKGFSDKYFYDKGILFYTVSPKLYKPLILLNVIRRGNLFKEYCSKYKAYKLMVKGVKMFKKGEY